MKNKTTLIFLSFIIVLTVTSCSLFGMDDLPQGDLMETSTSPDGSYTVNSYLVSGNATTDFSVRCEVIENSSENKWNIYWEYHCDSAYIEWVDDTTVEINGKQLNVITDSYDWRR